METKETRWGLWLGIILIVVLMVFGVYELIKMQKAGKGNEVINLPPPVSTSTVPDLVPVDWKAYSSKDYGFSFRYPGTIKFEKDVTVYDQITGEPTKYKANEEIKTSVDDISDVATEARNSHLVISPLYMNIQVAKKPTGFTTLKKYTDDVVDQVTAAGERSAAGVYADSNPFSQDGISGYLVVISDGSVVKNRDDNYYFEHGDYIYLLDIAYSGYNYQIKEPDEMARVDLDRQILASFKFTR